MAIKFLKNKWEKYLNQPMCSVMYELQLKGYITTLIKINKDYILKIWDKDENISQKISFNQDLICTKINYDYY